MKNLSKLIKKTIVDKRGKKTTVWVDPKTGEPAGKQPKKQDEQGNQKPKKSIDEHAKSTSTEKLKAFIAKKDKDPKHVSVAKKELSAREAGTSKEPEKTGKEGTGKEGTEKDKSVKSPQKKKEWFHDLNKKHNLDRLPLDVKKEDVVVDESDPDNKWVMKWKDKKTGRTHFSYTKKFLQKNAEVKWDRVSNISESHVKVAKNKTLGFLDDTDPVVAQSAAVINIIANTGLRPGNKVMFNQTGNRGVTTLSPDDVIVEGDVVSFKFQGKSYKQNTAIIENKKLANYMTKLKEDRQGRNFLFDVSREQVMNVFRDQLGFTKFKLKDLRTYVATDLAKKVLFNDPFPPPPIPKRGIQAAIQKKLKHCFKVVSDQLNNTPAMAKSSYIHPNVIDSWIVSLGAKKDLIAKGQVEEDDEVLEEPTLEDLATKSEDKKDTADYNDNYEEDEDVDSYPLPNWWNEKLDEEDIKKGDEPDLLKAEEEIDFNYKKYMKKSLKKKREDMPQIDPDDIDSFLIHFSDKYKVKKYTKKISELKPTQDDIIDEKITKKIKDKEDWKNRKYIISLDNYLVDGHHSWAQGLEFNPEQEVTVYRVNLPIRKLLSAVKKMKISYTKNDKDEVIEKAKKVIKNAIKGGKADGKDAESIAALHNVSVKLINKQIEIGVKIEQEHTDDKAKAREIAMDHLVEIPDYYTRLEEMEEQAKKEGKMKEGDEIKKSSRICELNGFYALLIYQE